MVSLLILKRWIAYPPIPSDHRILFFSRDRDDYGFLSNFYESEFELEGIIWPHMEAFYQASKSTNRQYKDYILRKAKPSWSKYAGDSRVGDPRLSKKSWFRKHPEDLRTDWSEIRTREMKRGLEQKFRQNSHLLGALLATGDAMIIEDSTNDSYWGIGKHGKGENTMGLLLMEIRSIFRNDSIEIR